MAVETSEITFARFGPYKVNRAIVLSIQWNKIPWYKRLGAVLALPYQLMRFLITGNADFLMVKNVEMN